MEALIVLIFIFFLMLSSFALAGISLAPWMPTRKKDLGRVFRLANLKPGEIFYDLGAGDGRVALYAARNFPVKAVGIEMAWLLWLVCIVRNGLTKIKGAKSKGEVVFKCKNLFRQDLSRADVVFVFGMPGSIKLKLRQKLEQELKIGARVVSYAFSFPGWEPKALDKFQKGDIIIYLYQIGQCQKLKLEK